jgi:hypothetical protein
MSGPQLRLSLCKCCQSVTKTKRGKGETYLLPARHQPPDLLAHRHHLADHGVQVRLPAVARRGRSDAVGVVQHELQQHAHDAAALAEGRGGPRLLRRLCAADHALHFRF